MTDEGMGAVPLDDHTRAAIREGLQQARRGEFVPDAEIEALWKRFGFIREYRYSLPRALDNINAILGYLERP